MRKTKLPSTKSFTLDITTLRPLESDKLEAVAGASTRPRVCPSTDPSTVKV
jgi:hypothetical protein